MSSIVYGQLTEDEKHEFAHLAELTSVVKAFLAEGNHVIQHIEHLQQHLLDEFGTKYDIPPNTRIEITQDGYVLQAQPEDDGEATD